MNNRILIKTIKDFLALTEFKTKCDGAGAVSLNFENKRIGIAYNKGVKGLRMSPQIAGYISFPEVENILKPYYQKYGLGYQPYTIYKSSRRFEHLSVIDLSTPEDIQKVGTELKTMVYEDILPFFEKYQDIHQVYDEMESLEKSQISRFIYHPPTIRMMIIKRLVNEPNWGEFAMGVVNNYKQWSEESNAITYKPYADFLPELYEELQNIKPIV